MAIDKLAFVDPSAQVHESAEIGPTARVGPHCRIGEGTIVMQGAFLGPRVVCGAGNVFHPYCVIGQDPQFLGFKPETSSGTVIGDRNHFREFSTVHRGLKDDGNTVIGNDNYFMAYAHIAHDCMIGSNVVMVNYAAASGHTEIADKVFFSGQSATHQFCRIGTLAMIGGQGGVVKDVPPYMTLKHYGVLVGLNTVGLRRAGIGLETRMALRDAYKEMFRSGRPVTKSIELIRAKWEGRAMPAELAHLLDFCSVKSKRGLSHGPRANSPIDGDDEDDA